MTRTLSIGITTKDRPRHFARASSRSRCSIICLQRFSFTTMDRRFLLNASSGRWRRPSESSSNDHATDWSPAAIVWSPPPARTLVLLLDDDARLLTAEAVERAIETIRRDPRVGAVAFAQAEADGRPWPAEMQPSRATSASLVASFIGFAHLVTTVDVSGRSAGIASRSDSTGKKRISVCGCSIRAT